MTSAFVDAHDAGDRPRMEPEGDRAIRVEFGIRIEPAVNRRVHRFCRAVNAASINGIIETIPAYAVATVFYDPFTIDTATLLRRLASLHNARIAPHQYESGARIEIPVLYGGEWGPDLGDLASAHDLTEETVVALHSGCDYLCYMLGFAPGFAYLGEVAQILRTPRLATPRLRVAMGSVGIADAQTAVYPQDSPAGWNIVGRTPVRLVNWTSDPPVLIRPGDVVRFVQVDEAQYAEIAAAIERGEYNIPRTPIMP